jgi:hypothetical protein
MISVFTKAEGVDEIYRLAKKHLAYAKACKTAAAKH